MTFNPNTYYSNKNTNFYSMGMKKGNYSMDKRAVNSMYESIAFGHLDQYCMVEKKTPYFKLFWDFDIKDITGFEKIDVSKFWTYLVNTLVLILRRYIVEKSNKTFQYIWSDRPDTDKGLHIYFPYITLNSEYCLLIREQLIRYLLKCNSYDFLDEITWGKIVDSSVFKANGLRTLFQKKYDDKTKIQQQGYYVININKSTHTNIPTNKVQQLQLTSIRSSKTTINVNLQLNNKTQLPILDIFKEKAIIAEKQNTDKKPTENANPKDIQVLKEQVYDMDLVNKFAHNLSIFRITTYDTWLRFIFLCRNYGWVDLAHEISKKAKNYSAKSVNTMLKSPAKGKLYTIASLIYWSKLDNLENHNKIIENHDMAKLILKQLTFTHTDTFEKYADEVYENDYVNKLDLINYDTFIIKAPTGTGKTERIIECIDKLVKDKKADRISVIASRIVLAINIYGRFQEPLHGKTKPLNLGMTLYSDVDKKSTSLWKEKRLVQTPDSLIHMVKPYSNVKYNVDSEENSEEYSENTEDSNEDEKSRLNFPDIVFIDEIESLLEYVCTSSTLYRCRREVFTILNAYIVNAKYVFLVDSNVTIPVCNYIKKLRRGHNVNVIFNKKLTNDTNYYLTYDELYFTKKILESIEKGQNIFIGSDSKKQTEMLETRIKECGGTVKVYNCDTDDASRNALSEVNTEWVKYNAVICSPTILYGVDFNATHFHTVFGYYTKTINASSVYQQLNRVRKIQNKKAYIFIMDYNNSNVHPMPTKTTEIGKYYFRYQAEFLKTLDMLAIDYLNLHSLNEKDLFTKLYLHFQAETNRCGNSYETRLTKYLTEFGGKFYKLEIPVNPKHMKLFFDEKSLRRKEVDQKNWNLLAQASKHIDQASEINKKKWKTTNDRRILTASRICNKMHFSELNYDFMEALRDVKNFDKLVESFNYFRSGKELVLSGKDNLDNNIELFNKKKELIDSGIKLFFKGLLSNGECFLLHDEPLSPLQDQWIKKNLTDILYCFKSIRSDRIHYETKQDLMKIVNGITEDFFAGYISICKSDRIRKQVNKVKTSGNKYSIYSAHYLELLLTTNQTLNPETYKFCRENKYAKQGCIYKNLHGFKDLESLIEKHMQIQKDRDVLMTDVDFLEV